MKTNFSGIISTLMIVGMFLITSCQSEKVSQIVIEGESIYGFDQTVEVLQENIKGKGYSIPIVHDMQANMLKAGVEVAPAKIIEICHAGRAGMILTNDSVRYNLAMLPCRITVYEKEDGNTYVSWMSYEHFSKLEHGESMEVFSLITSDIEGFIKPLLK